MLEKEPFDLSDPGEVRFQTAAGLISALYNVELTPLTDPGRTGAFCRRHRLGSIQQYLNENRLASLCASLDDHVVYLIKDPFLLHLILFSFGGVPMVFGPFCPEHLTVTGAAAVIRQYSLEGIDPLQLSAYCGTYPSLSELNARKIITALIHTVRPQEPDKTIRILSGIPDSTKADGNEPGPRANHSTLIERRYAAERQMVESIRQGDARAAIQQSHIVEQDVTYLSLRTPTIEQNRIGAAIFRTTVRHAAIEAGLPALVIDRLTTENAKEVSAARDEQAVLLAKDRLVRRVCRAIRDAREHGYSALVMNTLHSLEHDYKNEISIENLSAEFGVSENRLISVFKKETGFTPNAYLTRVRMEKAAGLLANGQMSVGDVSMAVGLQDPNYFVKLFKKAYGETPTSYRRRHTV